MLEHPVVALREKLASLLVKLSAVPAVGTALLERLPRIAAEQKDPEQVVNLLTSVMNNRGPGDELACDVVRSFARNVGADYATTLLSAKVLERVLGKPKLQTSTWREFVLREPEHPQQWVTRALLPDLPRELGKR